jgi:hypothetical protein
MTKVFTAGEVLTAADVNTYLVNTTGSGNAIINGAFDIWQRGTSVAVGTGGFLADRWRVTVDAAPTTATISRQSFTPGELNSIGFGNAEFYQRISLTTIGSTTACTFETRVENVQTLANQQVTVSFWAKADSARSLSTGILRQNFGSGGSANVDTALSTVNLTTSWQRFTTTVTLPSLSGKTIGAGNYLMLRYNLPVVNGVTIDIWGVQLDAGPVATPFRRNANTIQGELAACQRYFYRAAVGSEGAGNIENVCHGQVYTTTQAIYIMRLSQEMRARPSFSVSAVGDFGTTTSNFTVATTTALSFSSQSTRRTVRLDGTIGSALLTAGNTSTLLGNNANATMDFSSEL